MGLLTVIKKDQNIRKIFEKRELVIIQKQLLGVRLTKSETTRLSRDIRKKFLAIESLSNFEFNIKKWRNKEYNRKGQRCNTRNKIL